MSHAAYIGIIGAAHARAADSALHRAGVFEAMCAAVERVIVEDWQLQWDTVVLVSGGAAWGDHVAVALFMERACDSATDRRGAPKLRLLLPCKWDAAKKQFEDNGQVDWRINPGGTANTYHRQCSASTGRDTLADLEKAQKLGAAWQDDFFGFHHRNLRRRHWLHVGATAAHGRAGAPVAAVTGHGAAPQTRACCRRCRSVGRRRRRPASRPARTSAPLRLKQL